MSCRRVVKASKILHHSRSSTAVAACRRKHLWRSNIAVRTAYDGNADFTASLDAACLSRRKEEVKASKPL